MSCPYLTQVTMVFCRAAPVKKLVPSDRLTTASACEDERFQGCPAYREALERARQEIGDFEAEAHHPAGPKGAQS